MESIFFDCLTGVPLPHVLSEAVSILTDGVYGMVEGVTELSERVFALSVVRASVSRAEGVQRHLIFAFKRLLPSPPPQAEGGVGVVPHFEEWLTWHLSFIQCFGSVGPLSFGIQQTEEVVDEGVQLVGAEAHALAKA